MVLSVTATRAPSSALYSSSHPYTPRDQRHFETPQHHVPARTPTQSTSGLVRVSRARTSRLAAPPAIRHARGLRVHHQTVTTGVSCGQLRARTSRATQAALVPTWRGHLPQPAAQLQGVGRGRAEGMPDRWSGPNASHAAAQQPRTRPQGSARAPAARLPSRATYILKGSLGSDVSVTLNVTLDMAPAPTPAPNHLRARQTAAGRASSGARCAQRRRRSCRRGR